MVVFKINIQMKYHPFEISSEGLQEGTLGFKRGVCKILVSPPHNDLGWHMSISCASRDPLWNEIKEAWYDLIPDAENRNGAMFFPPKDEYVNLHKHCFHIHEVSKDLKTNLRIL